MAKKIAKGKASDPDRIETTEETFKKDVPFSFWVSPEFKWKKWLLAPYKSAQAWDKFLTKFKKSTGGEVTIKNVDKDLL